MIETAAADQPAAAHLLDRSAQQHRQHRRLSPDGRGDLDADGRAGSTRSCRSIGTTASMRGVRRRCCSVTSRRSRSSRWSRPNPRCCPAAGPARTRSKASASATSPPMWDPASWTRSIAVPTDDAEAMARRLAREEGSVRRHLVRCERDRRDLRLAERLGAGCDASSPAGDVGSIPQHRGVFAEEPRDWSALRAVDDPRVDLADDAAAEDQHADHEDDAGDDRSPGSRRWRDNSAALTTRPAPTTGPTIVPMPPSSVISTTSPDICQATSVSVASWNTIALIAPARPASAADMTKAAACSGATE